MTWRRVAVGGVLAMCAAQACAQIGAFAVAALLPTALVRGALAFLWLRPADLAGDRSALT